MENHWKAIKERIHRKLLDTNVPLVIFSLLVLILGIVMTRIATQRQVGNQAVNGYLYCSSIDNRYPIMLSGKWEYYKDTFLFPSDFNALGYEKTGKIPSYVQVPGPAPNPYGYGTYRLRFKFISHNDLFAIKTTDIRSSARIYIDGKLIGSIGDPSTLTNGSIPSNYPQYIIFPLDLRSVHEIIIQTSNYNYYQGGLTGPIYFGTQVEVYRLSNQAKLADSIAVMSIIVLATFLLVLLVLRIEMKNMKYLLLFSICFVLYLFTTGEKLIMPAAMSTFGYVAYTRANLSLTVLMGLFMVSYINTQPTQDRQKRWLIICWVTGALLVLGLLFSPQHLQGSVYHISILYIIISFAFSFVYLFKLLMERSFGALYQLLGFVCWSCLPIVFYFFNKGYLSGVGKNTMLILLVFGFVVFQILYISWHIASIYSANERLAKRMIISDKLKVDFMEITSHELRTPLHGIINITQSVAQKIKKHDDKRLGEGLEDLELVVTLARRMTGIVNDMHQLVSSGIDTKTDLKPTDLQMEVKAVFEVFGYSSDTRKIRLINHVSPKASTVYADERKLWQVLTNLIGNALKYTDSGSITIESREADGKVYISVTDTGIGMPAEEAKHIFDKSTRLASGAKKAQGLGLGLYITRKLVEDMGGDIFVEWTQPKKGTRITFTLDWCDRDEYSRLKMDEGESAAYEAIVGPELAHFSLPPDTRILLADDNPDNLKIVYDMFRDLNITIDTVQDGPSALKLLEKRTYDIVILDVMMPGMSGFEVCRSIRSQYSMFELPVLMLTAKDASEEILTGFWSGANDYIIKPADRIELRSRVFTLITLKQSVQAALKNELNFLQAQIRPHFLYNAFNTISAIALSDGAFASELIDDLSTYLRYCFRSDTQDDFVPIEDEIELVKAYLRIEKARFSDRLEIEMELEPALHFYLPPLTIQPIVENAVRHGSLGSCGTTKVKIKLYMEEDNAVIEVSDNGPGIEPSKIQAVLDGGVGDKNSGIGLINVNRRLKLRYNRSLQITSSPAEGTRVTLIIPVVSEGTP